MHTQVAGSSSPTCHTLRDLLSGSWPIEEGSTAATSATTAAQSRDCRVR